MYVFNYLPQVFIYQAPGANDLTPLVKKRLGLDKPVETKKPAEVKPAEPVESKIKTKK